MYCRYDSSPSEKLAKSIFALFIKQLMWKQKTTPQFLHDFYSQYTRDARNPSLEKYIDVLAKMSTKFDRILIVVDALDELEQDERGLILRHCQSLLKHSDRFRCFFTSRREEDIEFAFDEMGVEKMQIEARSTEADIRSFVEETVHELVSNQKLKLKDESLTTRIINTLVDRSDGMFLWVRLQLQLICREKRDADIIDALEALPRTIQDTYSRIELRIEQKSETLRLMAQRSLSLVFHAKRLLRSKELVQAVSFEPENTYLNNTEQYAIGDILDACSNLLMIENHHVRPVHYSVREYFLSRQLYLPQSSLRTNIQHSQAQKYIAKLCIEYLIVAGRQKVYDDDYLRQPWFVWQMLDFLNYACKNFDQHSTEVTGNLEEMNNILCELLSGPISLFKLILWFRETFGGGQSLDEIEDDIPAASLIYATKLYDVQTTYLTQFFAIHGTLVSLPLSKYTLHYASAAGLEKCVQRLLFDTRTGFVNDEKGARPLYHAAKHGHANICDLLLLRGDDVNNIGGGFGTALIAAVFRGHLTVVRKLLQHGAHVNERVDIYGTALQVASELDQVEIFDLLLDHGADVNISGGRLGTALQAAAKSGSEQQVQSLLEKGADVNIQGGIFETALQAAASYRSTDIVEILIKHGAQVNVLGGEYGSALHAASFRGDADTIKVLIEHGAQVNLQSSKYGLPLHAALEWGNADAIEVLIKCGAQVDLQSGAYGSALQAAAVHGHADAIEILIKHGAQVNLQSGTYGSALQAASARGNLAVMDVLLKHGAQVNLQSGGYGSALRAAAVLGRVHAVQFLLDNGADINLGGGKYDSALRAASSRGHQNVVDLLRNAGAKEWESNVGNETSSEEH